MLGSVPAGRSVISLGVVVSACSVACDGVEAAAEGTPSAIAKATTARDFGVEHIVWNITVNVS